MGVTRSERARSMALVIGLHLLVVWLVLNAAGGRPAAPPERTLRLFDAVPPTPPPPEPAPEPSRRSPEREGEAAPPALRAAPKPIVAPPPVAPIPPPPVLAAPVAGVADRPAAGAAPTPGPGTGAGGVGTGLGSGGAGDGTGGGGGLASRSRQVKGRIKHSDYPDAARRARRGGTVLARIDINTRGRVARCTVTRSSSDPDLDATTCRLIAARFRYAPARDALGRPAADVRHWRQDWWLEGGAD
jgi:protein TonB